MGVDVTVMGAGVFVMAEITEVPYVKIIAVAAVPGSIVSAVWLGVN